MSNRTIPRRLREELRTTTAPSDRRRARARRGAFAAAWVTGTWFVAQRTAQPTEPRLMVLVAWIALVLLVAIRPWLSRSWRRLEGRRRHRWAALSLVLGGLGTLVTPAETGRNAASVAPLYSVGVFLAWSLLFGSLLFVTGAWLTTRPKTSVEIADGSVGRWEWLSLAAPPMVVWSAYLLAFWPGVMSADSMEQWAQISSGDFTNWHPVFHTVTEWALTRLVESPAIVAAAQVAALSGVVGWGLAALRRLGLPTTVAWLASGAIAIWPANGITVITLWKDVAYAIAILALGVILLREVDGRNSVLDQRGGWAVVGGVASLVALFHHAGLVVAFGSLGALWLAVRRRTVIGAAAVTLLAVVVVQFGLFSLLDVPKIGHPGIDGVTIHHIGAHLDAGTKLTAADRAEIEELIPIAEPWYNCESVNSFVFNPNFSLQKMHEEAGRVRALWWSLFTRDPAADLQHVACSSHVVWRIRHVPGDYQYGTQLGFDPEGEVQTVAANDFGLTLDPVLNPLTGPLTDVIVETQEPAISWLWWRGAVYLYVLLSGAAVAALRAGDWRYWAVAAPAALVASTLIIAAPVQDYRYMWPVVLLAMVIGPYLFMVPSAESG